jgi:predicted MPP superfamily phosphohydrolase
MSLYILLSLLATATATSSTSPNYASSFVFLADLHVGEGCESSKTNYSLNDTNCYSIRDLNSTIHKVNEIVGNTSLIIVGGDLTSSAQTTEFLAAQKYLNNFESPFISTIGNHDIWSYDQVVGDRTSTAKGDLLFSQIFHNNFQNIATLGKFTYPNISIPDSRHPSAFLHGQSWTFRPGPSFSTALQALTFIAPDFNGRVKAPPPCPGHSPIGGCGVMGNADLNNITNGSWSWFENQLKQNEKNDIIYLVTHQPFRCRFGVPDWSFCFSKSMKKSFRTIVKKNHLEKAFERGSQLSGHQHRWYNGTAFDEWPNFRQFEVSAVKGDVFDSEMSSSFAIFHLNNISGKLQYIERWWLENNTWINKIDY